MHGPEKAEHCAKESRLTEINDIYRDLPIARRIFTNLAAVSNLHLNIQKTMLIPLGRSTPSQVRTRLEDAADPWNQMQISTHAKYLGFMTGPGKRSSSRDKPVFQYKSRVTSWQWSAVGLHGSATLMQYNAAVRPTLRCAT